MKKYLVIGFIFTIMIGFLSLNHEKVYGIVIDETEQSKEEIIQLSQDEIDFFDKMKLKQQYENEGIMVVDTINGTKKETIIMDGVKYEKDALIYSIYTASQNGDLDSAMKSHEEQLSNSSRNQLTKILDKANKGELQYTDIEMLIEDKVFIDEGKSFISSLIPNSIILDSRNYSMMTDYYYENVYFGYYQNYTTYNTTCGVYYIQAEYYKDILGNPIYTGATRYVLRTSLFTYNHIDVIQFDYQSYNIVLDGTSAPSATIYLIKDYWGEEKMIITSNEIGTPYKITQTEHYNRNQYNTINGVDVSEIYPTENTWTLFWDGWTHLADSRSYFHLLLSENSDNEKYTKPITYTDLNLGVEVAGGLELVFDGDGDVLDDTEDYLVLYTFNFGVDASDPEWELIPDVHYIRDVYPYLVWGNTEDDFNNHTPFERFIWDKASVNNNGDARDSDGEELMDMYYNGDIEDHGGTIIPIVVQNNSCRWDIYFNFIADQTIIKGQYSNFNWATKINGEYSSIIGTILKFEAQDSVMYNTIGNYSVRVGIEDAGGRKRYQYIVVSVIYGGC